MSFLLDSHIDFINSHIETKRCFLLPFSTDGRVDIRELQEEFCKANRNHWVNPLLPSYHEEYNYVKVSEEKAARWEGFENFIIDKRNNTLIWAGGLRILESWEINIGIWIREDRQGEGIATEIYEALIEWAGANTKHKYLVHSLNPENTWSQKLALKFGWVLQKEITESGHVIYHIPLQSY